MSPKFIKIAIGECACFVSGYNYSIPRARDGLFIKTNLVFSEKTEIHFESDVQID